MVGRGRFKSSQSSRKPGHSSDVLEEQASFYSKSGTSRKLSVLRRF